VQVMGAGVASASPAQVEAGPQKSGNGVGRPPGRPAIELAGQVVEEAEPGLRIDGWAVLDGHPEGRFGDVRGGVGRGGEDQVTGICGLHRRV